MYKATWTMEAYLNGSWVDITDDVLGMTRGEWGLGSANHTEFVADVGELTFDLRNYDPIGKYSPNHSNCLTGWKKGVPIRQSFYYKNELYKRFRFYVQNIENAGGKDERKRITALDWMEYAARNPIKNPGVLENMRGDEVLQETLALMPIQPQATDFDTGINTFPTAFDTVTSKTKAINEFSKVALSEIGHIYLIKDPTHGETLRFENAHARNGLIEPDVFYVPELNAGFLLLEEGGNYLLLEEGGAGRLELAGATEETLHLDNDASVLAYEFEDGENVINRFTVYAVPRRVDSSAQILFQLDAPIPISSGQTIVIRGTYANPEGGLPINANPDDMINPVATTDYRAFVNDDGTGTEFTGSLVVTPSYGTEGFSHTVYNSSSNSGYITLFNCRGYGIYTYNPTEYQEDDSSSQNEHGIISDAMTQKYKNDLGNGAIYADWVVDEEKEARTILKKIYLNANKDLFVMMAFLQLDVGSLIRVSEDKTETDSYYFIQGISYQTRPGGILMFQWILKPVLLLGLGLSELGVEFDGGSTDGINFGYIQLLDEVIHGEYSLSVWVNLDGSTGTTQNFISIHSDNGGVRIGASSTDNRDIFLYDSLFAGDSVGLWRTTTQPCTYNNLHHVVITYNSNASSDPIIYVDGNPITIIETATPSGIKDSGTFPITTIGNLKTSTVDYTQPTNGIIRDARVYNRILSPSEVTTLYNAGVPDMNLVTDGLVFQAFVLPTSRLSRYINQTLTHDMKLRDRIHGVIGTPHGTPTGRI